MLLHNEEKINEKQWQRNLEDKLVKDEKADVTAKVDSWFEEEKNLVLEEKEVKNKTKKELRHMMAVQENEIESQKKNNLKLEKKLLEDANKFDNFVTDIVAMKRQFLDKLREQRPF
jgi:cobalamin biosynthesis protein CobT